jgi:glyoxylase-like metal-dependent hydrolase (beta-lactamase superfamily II)
MAAYMDSLQLLLDRDDEVYWPTHGPSIIDPKTHVQAYIDHRLDRERQIIECIKQGTYHIREMVPLMYKDTPEFMYPAAARSVLAAMENLVRNQQVRVGGEGDATSMGMDSAYHLS